MPELRFAGKAGAVVGVIDWETDEPLYTLRIRGEAFRPWTFREGPHHVRLVSPDGTQTVELDLMALPAPEGSLEVSF